MRAAILASWLLTQHWSWTLIPEATSYRMYWGASGIAWCQQNMVEFDALTHCGTMNGCDTDMECCGDIPEPQYSAMIVVTAVNSSGESDTEHGPVVDCP